MFVTAIHRKRPEPNKSRSIQVLLWRRWRDIEPPRSARGKPPEAYLLPIFLAACRDFTRLPTLTNKKTPTSGVFLLAEMGECHSCTQQFFPPWMAKLLPCPPTMSTIGHLRPYHSTVSISCPAMSGFSNRMMLSSCAAKLRKFSLPYQYISVVLVFSSDG